MDFIQYLNASVEKNKSLVCVGLDTDAAKLPIHIKKGIDPASGKDKAEAILQFNCAIIDATKDLVCAYKPNSAFYEALGAHGIAVLQSTIAYIHHECGVPVILDAKRADIGSTNNAYIEFAFNYLAADAITVHPYLGREAVKPFLDHKEKGIIVLCRTSNPGAGEFQDLKVFPPSRHSEASAEESPTNVGSRAQEIPRQVRDDNGGEELYKIIARQVANEWNTNGNCALVVGATYPEELRTVRALVGDMPILVPGIGAQGGDVEKTVKAGIDSKGRGIIVNSSRGIIFASGDEDFAEAARREAMNLKDEINKFRG